MQHFARTRHPITSSLVALALLFAFVGCETGFAGLRATTFPPDLSYLPAERIRTVMWVLAAETQRLEGLLNLPDETAPANRRVEVSKSLGRMQVAMRTLDEPGRINQHPVVNQNFSRFLGRLERAKRGVDRDPPNYFYAISIAGSCAFCHEQSKATAMWRPATRGR